MLQIGPASEAYQAILEHQRAAREEMAPDEFLDELREDVARAQMAVEIAWLDSKFAQSS